MRKNLSTLLFFLILVFLPQQFGPHFWPASSYIHGIRLDYLSPTLYISELLLILLFVVSVKDVFKKKQTQKFFSNPLFLLFVLVICIPLGYATSPEALLYRILTISGLLYFGLYTATMTTKKDIGTAIWIFVALGACETFLGLFQFLRQGSLGGVFYFVGERFYTASSLGQAILSTSQGTLVRPYGTFSHPNVLSFFLFVSSVLSAYGMHNEKRKFKRYLLLTAFLITEAGIFLTFSRTIIFINVLFLLYSFGYVTLKESRHKIRNIFFSCFLVVFTILYLVFYNNRFLNLTSLGQSILPRQDLTQISLSAIFSSPFFGLGLNNFFFYEVLLQKNFSSMYLQPVHNVFLLIFSEVGLIGGACFVYFLGRTVLSAYKNIQLEKHIFSFSEIPFVLLLSLIFLGMFDHFPITIIQGELLSSFIFGLAWINFRSK